jgi:leucyl-tRNA synthetase
VIKKVTDQWFIDYANQKFTDMTKEHAKSMHILPNDYYTNVQPVLDWFRERACVRQGNWLGTKFPFDEKWIIEAISDSTLYPVYYLISKYVNSGELKTEQMSEAFFDYVILGRGELAMVAKATGVQSQLLEHIRADIDYWYPLDMNLGGKEHMTVHFPAFLMNHVAILPQQKWPKGIFVNWYVIGKAGKISKSKGGAQPIPGAAEKYGVDSLRLYYAHIASPFADVEWDEEIIENYVSRLDRIMRSVMEMAGMTEGTEMSGIDQWLLSRMASRVGKVTEAMKEYDLRVKSNEVYFETPNDIRWYTRRGGNNGNAVRQALDIWIRMMAPITPHVAEELWSELGNKTLVSSASYPKPEAEHSALAAELAEEYLREVMDDTNNILRVTKITPKRIVLYTSAAWKFAVYRMAIDQHKKGELKIPSLTKAAMADEEIRKHGKEAPDYARKLAEELMKRSGTEIERLETMIDEQSYLSGVVGFLGAELGCQVSVFSADDPEKEDPLNKARHAQPRRPAIYIE